MNKLEQAARHYMSVFGQALEAHGIPFSKDQLSAESALREALDHSGEADEMVVGWDRVKPEAIASDPLYQQGLVDGVEEGRNQVAEQAEQEPVAQQDSDDRRLLREIFMLCEATEELESTNDFMRGRIFEAKCIRRGIGTWYQDTFCGRSYMGEPVLNAAPVQQAEQEPVATMEVFSGWGDEANFEQLPFDLPDGVYKLYAAPVRTKDLTDDEVEAIMVEQGDLRTTAFARAVIAADREKNNANNNT